MVPSHVGHEADLDASAVVWQQHFGLNELQPQDEGQWEELEQWVKQVAPHLVLPASRDPRFLESLKRLKVRYLEHTAINSVVSAFEDQQQLSYSRKEKQLKKQMDLLNIDKEQLSAIGRSVCRSTANIACALDVQDPTFSNIQAALARMNMECMALNLEKDEVQDQRMRFKEKISQTKQIFDVMSRALSSLNERYETVHKHEISNWKTEITLLDRKSEEYRNRVTTLQDEYATQGLDDNGLLFSKLKEFQQEVETLEKIMEVKQQELAQFLDLPLDIKIAAGKLRSLYDTLVRFDI
ncbi:hypothetical protein K450DRAFT_221361 [Umbelopsis ramanniana AG]|uniref:Uncharacterized protein n=1 Tax=Umbelopsis ramanniana AG TaxID=1314678 RepID=A0AAD5HH09_UMBRA|nr:uncharacterized protein K450DRAFT_221361 [Umbelopsis ramanniana AG]KAI8584070.1 hypothetical protein K450DRAFT_221361 [Umbelopsis ramanniana AG]